MVSQVLPQKVPLLAVCVDMSGGKVVIVSVIPSGVGNGPLSVSVLLPTLTSPEGSKDIVCDPNMYAGPPG